jgi:hypothetical protein
VGTFFNIALRSFVGGAAVQAFQLWAFRDTWRGFKSFS